MLPWNRVGRGASIRIPEGWKETERPPLNSLLVGFPRAGRARHPLQVKTPTGSRWLSPRA